MSDGRRLPINRERIEASKKPRIDRPWALRVSETEEHRARNNAPESGRPEAGDRLMCWIGSRSTVAQRGR